MKQYLFLLLVFFININKVFSQQILQKDTLQKEPIERQAEFIGGVSALMKYLKDNTKSPENPFHLLYRVRIVGKFIVEKDGSIGFVKIIEDKNTREDILHLIIQKNSSFFHPLSAEKKKDAERMVNEIYNETIRVLAKQPTWIAGIQGSKNVRSHFTCPITFSYGM